jgi:hypothetical protein
MSVPAAHAPPRPRRSAPRPPYRPTQRPAATGRYSTDARGAQRAGADRAGGARRCPACRPRRCPWGNRPRFERTSPGPIEPGDARCSASAPRTARRRHRAQSGTGRLRAGRGEPGPAPNAVAAETRVREPYLSNDLPGQKARRLAQRASCPTSSRTIPQKREEALRTGAIKQLFRSRTGRATRVRRASGRRRGVDVALQDALERRPRGGREGFLGGPAAGRECRAIIPPQDRRSPARAAP